ncbi:MAG: elongation factor P [Candidatus Fermentibacteraceae bacterium]|nr:elongation factor P [Candidatus Fermentibacteraceae bacterium]
MATSNDFRRGMVIDIDSILYQIVNFQHVKPGKGPAFVRSKLKGVLSGKVLDRTWRAGEKVTEVRVEHRIWELLYITDLAYVVMNPDTYEQENLDLDLVGDAAKYLIENSEVKIAFVDNIPIIVEPPDTVVLKVTNTDPGLRGDTASGGSKPAILQTGLQIQVPLFIQEGDVIKIDTRNDSYIERKSS